MGSHQRFQRFTVRRQNNHRIGGQPGHHDFPSQLPIRHATAPPIRLLFCYRKAASLRLPSYLHARRTIFQRGCERGGKTFSPTLVYRVVIVWGSFPIARAAATIAPVEVPATMFARVATSNLRPFRFSSSFAW